ncbi:MAG: CBS domain-containing protein [Candidatus Sungbacteria bacterium]|nr:CBS domain-containing protein [bacterium]MDZ4260467.1 CBS domain-containing protein [Candidatus Sungbacteria bacterium]
MDTELPTVKDIMTKSVISVHPEMRLFDAHEIITRSNLDGVPVVDAEGHVMGILTEYDMLSKASVLHLPTLQKIVKHLQSFIDKGGLAEFRSELEEMKNLTVAGVMNRDPLTLLDSTSFEIAVETFFKHHRVNPILVVDAQGKLVGIVSRYDVLKIFEQLKKL